MDSGMVASLSAASTEFFAFTHYHVARMPKELMINSLKQEHLQAAQVVRELTELYKINVC